MNFKKIISLVYFIIFIATVSGQSHNDSSKIVIDYGDNGFDFSTTDGNYRLQLQSRLQFRFAYPFDTDPVTYTDFSQDERPVLKVNRARLKVGGNAFRPWLKYFWEYELAAGNLLDFRIMVEKYKYFNIKIGQWKIHFNRERVISSGKQQMADRSMITKAFTIDRQQGISIYGRVLGSSALDFNYWVSVLTGTGRGSRENDDGNLMYMSRLQWNPFGRIVKFTGSDINGHDNPAVLIALAGVTNQSPYTRFSQEGGGQLTGFEDGETGQYRVNQAVVETAFMYNGFSWQHESHLKEINDNKNLEITTLLGHYFQAGYFFSNSFDWYPRQLEIAMRYAIYNPDRDLDGNLQEELSLNFNWFFKGHLNKLSAEISLFDFEETTDNIQDGFRFRIQWDISI